VGPSASHQLPWQEWETRFIGYGGNPLAINYAQWVSFIRAPFRYTNTELLQPGASTAGLLDQYQVNRSKLAELWAQAARQEPTPRS